MLSEVPMQTLGGRLFRLLTLRGDAGMVVALMDWGATLLSARIPLSDGSVREAPLECVSLEQYPEQAVLLGAPIGRYADRIADSRYAFAGETAELVLSQGDNQLHSGPDGFDKRRWQIISQSDRQVLFALTSDDGDQGFPDHLCATAQYRLTDDNHTPITYHTTVDKLCLVDLTNHVYFNPDGGKTDVCQHKLQIMADEYLPIDEMGIPHDGLRSAAGNIFDFRSAKITSNGFFTDGDQCKVEGYDHAFLSRAQSNTCMPVVRLWFRDKRLQMVVYTSAPALQFYSGNFPGGTPSHGPGAYEDWQGLTLESEFLPDSLNHSEWQQPDCFLRPGEEYASVTGYQSPPV